MTDTRCRIPRCRSESALIYMGRGICSACWSRIANASVEDEPQFLADIGLVRTEDGLVVERTGRPSIPAFKGLGTS